MAQLSSNLRFDAGLRRLVSIDRSLGLGKLGDIDLAPRSLRPLRLDPTDARLDGNVDTYSGVQWPGPIDELAEIVNQ
jgi:hypothetical protein